MRAVKVIRLRAKMSPDLVSKMTTIKTKCTPYPPRKNNIAMKRAASFSNSTDASQNAIFRMNSALLEMTVPNALIPATSTLNKTVLLNNTTMVKPTTPKNSQGLQKILLPLTPVPQLKQKLPIVDSMCKRKINVPFKSADLTTTATTSKTTTIATTTTAHTDDFSEYLIFDSPQNNSTTEDFESLIGDDNTILNDEVYSENEAPGADLTILNDNDMHIPEVNPHVNGLISMLRI